MPIDHDLYLVLGVDPSASASQIRHAYAPNALGNFEFEVTLSYRRLERTRRVEVTSRHRR